MRRRLAALAVVLAAICCGSLLCVNLAAAAGSGSISGLVTSPSGAGIANVSVWVYENGVSVAQASTASDGSYTVGSLAAGSCTVRFTPPAAAASGPDSANYLTQNYDAKPLSAAADPVVVQSGATTSDIDAVLQPGGSISGVVLDSSGDPVGGIIVSASDSDGVAVGTSATTAADGSYSIDRLPTGEYTVSFLTALPPATYASDYFGGSSTIAGAYGVAVTAGSTTSGVDAHLVAGGELTGTVTDASDAPVANVIVGLYDSSGDIVGSAVTGADGTFVVTGISSGSYRVGFTPGSGPITPGANYLPSYDGGANTLAGSTAVQVAAGSTTAGIDAQLAPGAEIEGTVTDAGENPVAGVSVTAYASDGTTVAVATTASDGSYEMSGLQSGSYKVGFNPNEGSGLPPLNDVAQFYGGSSLAGASAVAVSAGGQPAVISAQLAAGATISGTVTDSLGDPLSDVPVVAYDADGNIVSGATSAHFTGAYEIEGLPADTYRIGFDQGAGCCSTAGDYSPQFSGDSSTLAGAQTVKVTTGGSATGVDAALDSGGAIAGRITDSNGAPLGDITVEVFDSSGNVVGLTESFDDGTYWLYGLASGTYRLQYQGYFAQAGPLIDAEYYGGSATLSGATPVTVTAGVTTSGIDMQVARSTGAITGIATDTAGNPLAGASVTVYDTSGSAVETEPSAADGSFTLTGIEPGFYRIGFALAGYVSSFYPGASALSSAPLVYVASAATATGIDGTLAPIVSGTSPATGTPPEQTTSQPAQQQQPQQQPVSPGEAASVTELCVLPSVQKLRLSSRRLLRIPVRCLEATSCAGTVTLTIKHGKTQLKLGSTTVEIAPGAKRYASVKLNAIGARLLAQARDRLRVTVTLSIVGSATQKQTLRESVLIA